MSGVQSWCWKTVSPLFVVALVVSSVVKADDYDDSEFDKIEELPIICERSPDNGLPVRVIITRNGTGLFSAPAADAEKMRDLGAFERYFFFGKRDGFCEVGRDPLTREGNGFAPEDSCLIWDHNEMIYLDGSSVPTDTDTIHMWDSEAMARKGSPDDAIYSEDVDRDASIGDIWFPVVKKDASETLYKVAFIFGGDEGESDEAGEALTDDQKRELYDNLPMVNIVFLMDATGSMGPYIEEAKDQAVALVDRLSESEGLTNLKTGEAFEVDVRFGLVGYRDEGEEFLAKVFVPLTSNPAEIRSRIRSLDAAGGGDLPEAIVPALGQTLDELDFRRGALNLVVLIGDAPAHAEKEQLRKTGVEAAAQYVVVHGLVCRDDAAVRGSFEDLVSGSQLGSVRLLSDADEMIEVVAQQVQERLMLVPVESELVRRGLERDESVRDTASTMGLSEKETRNMQKLLVARGADFVSSGITFDEAWMRIAPGAGARIKVYSYMSRRELSENIKQMLAARRALSTGRRKAAAAKDLVRSYLKNHAGEGATAGLASSGTSVEEISEALPDASEGLKRGEKGVLVDIATTSKKLESLMTIWRDKSQWEYGHAKVPVQDLP